MNRDMMVHVTPFEVHVAILEDDALVEYHIERRKDASIVGNIYKGRVGKVLPGMQSAFVDIGLEKNAFLYVTDFFEEHAELKETIDDDDDDSARRTPSRSGRDRREERKDEAASAAEPVAVVETREKTESAGKKSDTAQPDTPPHGTPAGDHHDRRGRRSPRKAEAASPPASGEKAAITIAPPEPDSPPADVSTESVEAAAKAISHPVESPPVPADTPAAAPPTDIEPPAPVKTTEKPRSPRRRSSTRQKMKEFALEQETEQILANDSEMTTELSFPAEETHFSTERSSRGRSGGRRRRRKPYSVGPNGEPANISTMLRQGQEIIAQIMKEPMALKSARITSHITLAGRLLVYMPTVNHVGVSRKIRSDQERKRLRSIIKTGLANGSGGFIVRTASDGCSEEELLQDMNYLQKTWLSIQERSNTVNSPALLNEELDLVGRLLRDKLDDTYQNIWVDDEDEYANILEFVDRFKPSMLPRVKLYNQNQPIFDYFNLRAEVQKATRQKVWLRSGGFIVINHTEALVAIDVNTGKYVGTSSNFEETITKINVDAAREIIRQIRLRNLGGIIVMDFIDMQDKKSKRQVLDVIQQELRRDKAPSKLIPFNEFGLVIMTRKRTSSALEKNLSESCPMCSGTGFTKSTSTVCYEIYSQVERMWSTLSGKSVVIRANPEVITALKTGEREVYEEIRRLTERDVVLIPDPLLAPQTFDVVNE